MIYPVKIEFREYPSGSYVDWSDYLVTDPAISKKVESDNEGEAGVITFDKASVVLRYEPGNAVYNAFSVDLSAKQRYLFRISAPKSNGTYVQMFEGMADFSTIEWPELSNEISFDIIDKLSALSILPIDLQRPTSIECIALRGDPTATLAQIFSGTGSNGIYSATGHDWGTFGNNGDEAIIVTFQGDTSQFWGGYPTNALGSTPLVNRGETLFTLNGQNYIVKDSWVDNVPSTLATALGFTVTATWVRLTPTIIAGTSAATNSLALGIPNVALSTYYDEAAEYIDILSATADANGHYNCLIGFDVLKIIQALVNHLWTSANIINLSGVLSYPIPVSSFSQLINENPFGQAPIDALKTIAASMQCYIYYNKTGDLVIQKKANLGSNGTSRSIGTTKIYSKTKKYFWDKIVDGVTVNVTSWEVGNDNKNLIGAATATMQFPGTVASITPKNPINQTFFASNTGVLTDAANSTYEQALLAFKNATAIYLTGHDTTLYNIAVNTYNNALSTYQQLLNSWALANAQSTLSFYGLRHAAKDIVLRLDDNTIDWEILDNLTDTDGIKYFFTKIDFDLAAREVTLSPIVEITGHSYDMRQLSIGFSETNALNISNTGTVGSSSSSLAPVSTVTISDTTPQFDRVGIGKPPDDIYQLAILGDGWLTGNLKVDGKIYITGLIDEVNQTNLNIADLTIGLNKGGDNTTAIGGGIIVKGTSDSNLATILYDGAQWSMNFGLNIPSAADFKINNVSVLNSTTLGNNVVNSSLTKVGTLTTGAWHAAKIDATYLNYNTTHFNNSSGLLAASNITASSTNGMSITTPFTLGSAIVINTPQDIRSTASPTFANETLTGVLTTQGAGVNNFAGTLTVQGAGANTFTGTLISQGTGANTFAGSIGTPVFASESTGWQITSAGAADFRYLYTDQLHAKAFIADLEQALAGSQIISKSVAKIAADCYVTYSGSLTVESFAGYPNIDVFQATDLIRLRQFSRANGGLTITDSWITVTGTPSYNADGTRQTWSFNFASGNNNVTIKAGSLALDYGTSANNWGIIEQTTLDGYWGSYSPYWQIVTGNPAGVRTVQARLGNLTGITDSSFGGALSGFGLYAQNVYLKGKIIITNPGDINTSNLTNGAGWTNGATWGGNIGGIPSGLFNFSAPATGSGLFLDGTHLGFYNAAYVSTNPWRTYMDNSGGLYLSGTGANSLSWNGANLIVNGSGTFSGTITATAGAIGLWNIYSNYIRSGQVTLNADKGTIYVQKTDGGYVSVGQTLASTYTGYYGIAATDASSRYLFRLDNSANQIASWNIDYESIFSGTKGSNGAYTTSGITLGSAGFLSAPQFHLDTDGSAHFKGTLEAATGTFSGALSAATGTFSGAITSASFSTSAVLHGLGSYSSGIDISNVGTPTIELYATGSPYSYKTDIYAGTLTLAETSTSSSIQLQTYPATLGIYINGNKIIGTRQSAITNPTDAGSTTSAVIAILNAMRTHGLITT